MRKAYSLKAKSKPLTYWSNVPKVRADVVKTKKANASPFALASGKKAQKRLGTGVLTALRTSSRAVLSANQKKNRAALFGKRKSSKKK